MYYPRNTLALPPSSSSDPGSHSGPSSPLPTTVRAFISIAKKISIFFPRRLALPVISELTVLLNMF